MPTASAEMDGFSVEIAVRSVIKTAPAQKLFSPQRQQQMPREQKHTAVSSLPRDVPPAPSNSVHRLLVMSGY